MLLATGLSVVRSTDTMLSSTFSMYSCFDRCLRWNEVNDMLQGTPSL